MDYNDKLNGIIKLNNRLMKLKCSDKEISDKAEHTNSIKECKSKLKSEILYTLEFLSNNAKGDFNINTNNDTLK